MLKDLIEKCINEVKRIIDEKQKYIASIEEQQRRKTQEIDDKLKNLLEYTITIDDE
jgi:hypothetical protein